MIRKRIKIKNPQGLHARPASIFVKIANKYAAEVVVKKGRQKVNGKSIIGLMTLAANQGSTISIEVDGPDKQNVLTELEAFLNCTDEPGEYAGLT